MTDEIDIPVVDAPDVPADPDPPLEPVPDQGTPEDGVPSVLFTPEPGPLDDNDPSFVP